MLLIQINFTNSILEFEKQTTQILTDLFYQEWTNALNIVDAENAKSLLQNYETTTDAAFIEDLVAQAKITLRTFVEIYNGYSPSKKLGSKERQRFLALLITAIRQTERVKSNTIYSLHQIRNDRGHNMKEDIKKTIDNFTVVFDSMLSVIFSAMKTWYGLIIYEKYPTVSSHEIYIFKKQYDTFTRPFFEVIKRRGLQATGQMFSNLSFSF
ncbi:hypothetical protein CDIK_4356 [Cucumispora dikerogammari]|nr:hypothetical protein CDIK_4356 [Cucumispora dikerogammari]